MLGLNLRRIVLGLVLGRRKGPRSLVRWVTGNKLVITYQGREVLG